MAADRLSTLDSSFLALETGGAHMHVAWRGHFAPPASGRPTLQRLRAGIAGRLRHAPRFRQRLAFPPGALGEPYWVDDVEFDLNYHVRLLGDGFEPLSQERFHALSDAVLSEPLDRRRPLWEVHLAPRLTDGGAGLAMKMHHAMVDGVSAVELVMLVFDLTPDAEPEPPDDWSPRPPPGDAGLALRAAVDATSESLRAARQVAAAAASPLSSSVRLASGLRRTALAVGDDLLRPAPSAYVNCKIGPQRTLVGARLPLDRLVAIKRRAEVTHNDVCLAIVAGALRDLARRRGEPATPVKAMVPVNMRASRDGADAGNRISFAFVELPVGIAAPGGRLRAIHEQTLAFKRNERAAGTEGLLSALRFAPAPLKGYAARYAGSARVYNLTVSNVPGPRTPIYVAGCELVAAYPVVPISQDHALSIGIFTYRDNVFFGLYADPYALPDVEALPAALRSASSELARSDARTLIERRPAARTPAAAYRRGANHTEPRGAS
jgi:WS/DGAT/MGAT family acyltransferase